MPFGGVSLGVTSVVAVPVAELADAVCCQAMLHDSAVLLVLCCLAKACRIHHPKIGTLGVDPELSVRCYGCPARVLVFLLSHGVKSRRRDLIAEICRVPVVLKSGDDVESERFVILQLQIPHRNMLGIKGVAHKLGDLHREPVHVEHLCLCPFGRIDNVVMRSLRSPPAVPKLVAVPEPVRGDLRGEHHLVDSFGRKSLGESVIGLLRLRETRRAKKQCRTCKSEILLHKYLFEYV